MKTCKIYFVAASMLISPVVNAQLPTLGEKPWLGYFAGHETRDFRIGIKSDTSIILEVKSSKGTPMGFSRAILLDPVISETADGKTVTKKIDEMTLTTNDKPSDKPEKLTFRGKVTGGAEFEMVVEFDRNIMRFGGRLLDKGTITNPVKFQVRCRFQRPYSYTAKDKLKAETEDDEIKYISTNKKRGKLGIYEKVDFSDEKTFGPMSAIEVEMKAYDKRFLYQLQGPGHLSLENPSGKASSPMDGFRVNWNADPEKDAKGEGRMIFEIK